MEQLSLIKLWMRHKLYITIWKVLGNLKTVLNEIEVQKLLLHSAINGAKLKIRSMATKFKSCMDGMVLSLRGVFNMHHN